MYITQLPSLTIPFILLFNIYDSHTIVSIENWFKICIVSYPDEKKGIEKKRKRKNHKNDLIKIMIGIFGWIVIINSRVYQFSTERRWNYSRVYSSHGWAAFLYSLPLSVQQQPYYDYKHFFFRSFLSFSSFQRYQTTQHTHTPANLDLYSCAVVSAEWTPSLKI